MLKAIKYVTFNIFVFQSKLRKLNTLKDYLKLTQFSASKNKYKFPVTNEMLTIRMHLVCIINQLEQRAIDILHIVVKEMYLVPFFFACFDKKDRLYFERVVSICLHLPTTTKSWQAEKER